MVKKIFYTAIAVSLLAGSSLGIGSAQAAKCGIGCATYDYSSLENSSSRIPDTYIPFQDDATLPARPSLLLEIGDPFQATGSIDRGFEIPTGAVWQPRLWVYGNYRTVVQHVDTDAANGVISWNNRLDLFANLQLTGTERILLGMTPLNNKQGEFTGRAIRPKSRFVNGLNADVASLFFEGEIGEIFPKIDFFDKLPLDLGFSVGRQEISFADGIIVNDNMDLVSLTKNNISTAWLPDVSKIRATAVFGWDSINRNNNVEDDEAEFYGFFTRWDTIERTYDFDMAYVNSDDNVQGDVFVVGGAVIQRIGHYNMTTRLLASMSDSDSVASDDGYLFFNELSWTPYHTHDLVYINLYAGFDKFRSAAREQFRGGPLGRAGILFGGTGIGGFPPALGNRIDNSVGGAVGYQWFSEKRDRNVVVEAGGRFDDQLNNGQNSAALGVRYQHNFGSRYVWRSDAYGRVRGDTDPISAFRTELMVRF